MWARRLIYTLLAILPVMFTAAIAVGTRLTPMDWTTPEFGAKTNEALREYAPLVRRTLEEAPANMHPDPAKIERTAYAWIDANYPPLSAGNMPASGLDGPLYDIQRARQLMCLNLMRAAAQRDAAGDAAQAAHLYGLTVRVAEVAKYSSLNSISTGTDSQREALKQMLLIVPKLDADARAKLASEIESVSVRPDSVALSAAKLMDATHELMGTAKALKRYASVSMTSVSLADTKGQVVAPDMTTEEMTVIGLAEAAQAATVDLGARRAEVLRALATKD